MKDEKLDRRTVLKAAGATAAALTIGRSAHTAGRDTLRVGLIGCGGRGTGAAINCKDAAEGVEIVALGDVFPDRVDSSRTELANLFTAARQENPAARWFQVTDQTCFTGFDAYRQVLAQDVDLVILATPPHFRPLHLQAAIEAGKHVFMEKPVAVDPVGVRKVIAASELAAAKGLGIVAGTQRRHQASYLDVIGRIHDGAIGEVLGGECYWNQGFLWVVERTSEMTDMEWQLRNWLYFTWLSGDHICEQHIHNLDVMNWVLGSPPARATAMGGRQVRTDPKYGHIFDHFAVELEYPGGQVVHSYCRQIDGCADRVAERVVGSKGVADPAGSIRGAASHRHRDDGTDGNPYEREHTDLLASIRAGAPLNEGRQVAESTLTAILGRMSAYTGKSITWEQAMQSTLDLSPPSYAMDQALPVAPVAVPGQTKFE
ncbi:MAG: Gfo/Idh/MocA family oxidoreductase [Planctomycetota bacterium]